MYTNRQTGLVGHWEFKEKSGLYAYDSSRYKNTGTLGDGVDVTNNPIWTEKGMRFDGVNDYVDAGNGARLWTIVLVFVFGELLSEVLNCNKDWQVDESCLRSTLSNW